jgi:glucose dehydrogenase
MSRTAVRSTIWWPVAFTLAAIAFAPPRMSGEAPPSGFPSKERGEWATYNADVKGSRYMPLDQVNASNFSRLEIAW